MTLAALNEPYGSWEREYLAAFPALATVMDRMRAISAAQLADPAQDILHNRLCAALAWKLGREAALEERRLRLALTADLLHNIGKEDPAALLTAKEVLSAATAMVERLRAAGYFRSSPVFWSRPSLFDNPKIGANRALVHHITGAAAAERLMREIGGFTRADIDEVQAAILAHSTGYPYLREAVDAEARAPGAWRALFPEPESAAEILAHDADLVSQFVPDSVLPPDAKWRKIARERWGASNARQEAKIIGEVLSRLKDEVRSDVGRRLAEEHWAALKDRIRGQSPI